MLGILLLKSPSGSSNGKSRELRINENHKYQPDIQNVKTNAPAAYVVCTVSNVVVDRPGFVLTICSPWATESLPSAAVQYDDINMKNAMSMKKKVITRVMFVRREART